MPPGLGDEVRISLLEGSRSRTALRGSGYHRCGSLAGRGPAPPAYGTARSAPSSSTVRMERIPIPFLQVDSKAPETPEQAAPPDRRAIAREARRLAREVDRRLAREQPAPALDPASAHRHGRKSPRTAPAPSRSRTHRKSTTPPAYLERRGA